ncbi:thiamine pyrophosphate-dependent enzyme [Dactylosporangium sp. NPDC050688]|uniref:thiamine pyrophosphate-dependent enzyme n=1 Tax=Dactylosporangium sp. NPDC050688 TaxID=3157217 RepID=UPI0033F7CD39
MSQTTLHAPARTNRSDATSQPRALVQNSLAPGTVDLPSLVPLIYAMMFRNIASDGFIFSDPQAPGDHSKDSKPGCIIAAPSFPADTAGIDEDYVFNWVRDGAITAMEVAKANLPVRPGGSVQTLNDYVQFAERCHGNQRVMVFSGDGGFQMTAQCLSTQTRFGLDPIIFVINNGVYGVEQWLADASVFTTDKPFYQSCVLHPWNYSRLAEVFGCQGWRVGTYGELTAAVKDALANTGGPSIIEVVVADKSIPSNAGWKTD